MYSPAHLTQRFDSDFMRKKRGFTIIELLVTVVIVSILASVALPMTELAVRRNKERILQHEVQVIREALDAYKQAGDEGNIVRKVGETGYPATLEMLVKGVPDAKNPLGAKLYFLRRIPRDPFFPDTRVAAGETWGKRSYASGPGDPKEGSDVYDVYSLSDGVGMNGVPYREW